MAKEPKDLKRPTMTSVKQAKVFLNLLGVTNVRRIKELADILDGVFQEGCEAERFFSVLEELNPGE